MTYASTNLRTSSRLGKVNGCEDLGHSMRGRLFVYAGEKVADHYEVEERSGST